MQKLLWIIVVIVLAIGGFVIFSPEKSSPVVQPQQSALKEYSNDTYGITLPYPNDWLATSTVQYGLTPIINVYKPTAASTPPPYIHHNNVTNVSIFPAGVPTEGLIAPTRQLDFDPGFNATNSIMFVLENGKPFAAYIQPVDKPSGWQEFGFIWARVYIPDLTSRCVDANDRETAADRCDPLTENHRILWSGTRDDIEWQEAINTLKSIEIEPRE